MSWIGNLIQGICANMTKVHSVNCYIQAGTVPRDDQQTTKFTIDPPADGDPDNFSVVTDGERLIKIPDGLAGVYIVHAWIYWQGNLGDRAWTAQDSQAGGFYSYVLRKDSNGERLGSARHTAAAVPSMYRTYNPILWEGQLNAGDTLEVFCKQTVIDQDPMGPVDVSAKGVLTVRRVGEHA